VPGFIGIHLLSMTLECPNLSGLNVTWDCWFVSCLDKDPGVCALALGEETHARLMTATMLTSLI
jgi:hypothetical protein